MANKEYSETYHLYFGTKAEEIDPVTLATALLSISTIVDELNKELHTNKKIDLKVKPFKAGSFDVPVEIVQFSIASVLSSTNISHIKDIVDFMVNVLDLRKHLKGSEPKTTNQIGDKVEITNNDGDVYIANNMTLNVYQNNPSVNKALDQQFQSLKLDTTISEFKINDDKNHSLIEVTRDEFEHLQETIIQKDEIVEKRSIKDKTTLNILKVVFDEKSKWDFYYRGNKIPVKIQDENFNKKVMAGEKFANGDLLDVELEIDQEFDEAANTFANKAYRILRVFKHRPRGEQPRLI